MGIGKWEMNLQSLIPTSQFNLPTSAYGGSTIVGTPSSFGSGSG
jgi:hypothetical protein